MALVAWHHRSFAAEDVMTASDVATLMRVPKPTAEDWARRGVIPSRKVSRRRLYIRVKIEGLLLGDDPRRTITKSLQSHEK
jgi:Helix-turn-helix domain